MGMGPRGARWSQRTIAWLLVAAVLSAVAATQLPEASVTAGATRTPAAPAASAAPKPAAAPNAAAAAGAVRPTPATAAQQPQPPLQQLQPKKQQQQKVSRADDATALSNLVLCIVKTGVYAHTHAPHPQTHGHTNTRTHTAAAPARPLWLARRRRAFDGARGQAGGVEALARGGGLRAQWT